jgi:WXG100 family type VII secretion target
MATIKIDPVLAHQTAHAIGSASGNLRETLSKLAGSVAQAQSRWDGSARQKFDPAWEELQRALTEVLTGLDQIGSAIEHEATAFEQADGTSSYS